MISEINEEDNDIAFGLCDLGMGFPELGNVFLPEIKELRGHLGLPIERDRSFKGEFPLSVYASAASAKQYITEDRKFLLQIQQGGK